MRRLCAGTTCAARIGATHANCCRLSAKLPHPLVTSPPMTNDPISDISIPELSFAEYVSTLTVALQAKYDLAVSGNVLQNDVMKMRFCPATPREPRVQLISSFHDENLFRVYSKSKTFFLYDYLKYRRMGEGDICPYEGSRYVAGYKKSPLQILAISIFVLNHWGLLLRADVEEIKAFGLDFHARCVAYTERVSRKKKD